MNINVQEIVNAKLKEMEEGKVLETLITSTVEKAVTKAVTDAIDGYSIKRILENKIEEDVKAGVEQVGFMAYNTLVAEQVNNLINSVIKDDLAQKISKVFERVMLNKREEVKMSEIVEEYRKLYEDLDYDDLQELDSGHFYIDWQEEDDGSFTWYTITFALQQQKKHSYSSSSKDKKIEMRLLKYKDNMPEIKFASFEGEDLHDMSKLRKVSEFEELIMNLLLNETKINMDIDEDDIDTYVGGDYWD
ncbi:MAG: hypothetical protein E6590_16775 [Clostridiales bacterium]|nr:hypothetical protein [Clostridiales bacterium]